MIIGYEFNTIISFSQPCNFTVYMATIDHMPPASITETPNRCNDLMMVNHMMINVKPNFTLKSYLSLSCEWCTALTYIRPFSIFISLLVQIMAWTDAQYLNHRCPSVSTGSLWTNFSEYRNAFENAISKTKYIPGLNVLVNAFICSLTHWGRDKMDAISQTTFWSAFCLMKMFEFRMKFHWSLFLRVELTIFKHWFR